MNFKKTSFLKNIARYGGVVYWEYLETENSYSPEINILVSECFISNNIAVFSAYFLKLSE